jgi:PAS domain S-box-containing protein
VIRTAHQTAPQSSFRDPEALSVNEGEATSTGISYVTDTSGRVTQFNRAWLEYTGLTAGESLGLAYTRVIHPDDLPTVLKSWEYSVNTVQPYRLEFRLRRADGVYRWHIGAAEPTFGAQGALLGWIGTAKEVRQSRPPALNPRHSEVLQEAIALGRTEEHLEATDFDHIEAILRVQTTQLQLSLDASKAGTWAWDFTADISSWDDRQHDLYGFLANAPRSLETWLSGVHPEDRSELQARIAQILETFSDNDWNQEFRVLHPILGERWMWSLGRTERDDQGNALRFAGIDLDITDRKHAEESLRHNQALFSSLIDAAPFGVYLVDGDFRLHALNEGSQAAFRGIDPLIGRDFAEITRLQWHEPFATEVIERFRNTLETGQAFLSEPIIEQRSNVERTESYDWQIHRVMMPDGRYGVVCYFYDLTELRQAEDAAIRSEERLRLGVQLAGLALADVDYIQDTIHLSKEAASMYGLGTSATSIPRSKLYATFHPDDQAFLEREIARALEPDGNGLIVCEHRVVHPDGSVRWLSVRKQILFDRSSRPHRPLRALLAAQDITDRKREELNLVVYADVQGVLARPMSADQMVREVADRVATHLGLTHCLFVEVNQSQRTMTVFHDHHVPTERSFEGKYNLNESDGLLERAQVISSELLVVDDIAALSHERATHFGNLGIQSLISTPFVTAGQWRFSLCALRNDPSVWREDEIALMQDLVGLVYPRIEHARAEAALSESEMRFRTVFENAPVGVAEIETATGRFIRSNKRHADIIGVALEVMPTISFADITHPDDLEPDLANMRKLVANEIREFTMEKRYIRGDGTLIWVNLSVAALWDVGAKPERHIAIVEDITERKRIEERLREISESQKRFVGDAAHELRAPLTSIQGNLEVFKRFPTAPADERAAMIDDASRDVARLGRLIADMLALARGDAGADLHLAPIALNDVLFEAAQTARPLAYEHHLEVGSLEPIIVAGHRDRLSQLALILLENAIKYTPSGGTVRLESHLHDSEVEFRVIDTGSGIAEEDLERVFERFYRADKARTRDGNDPGGTGLGLPIAKWIVQQHGGKIWLESELGVGTSAVVRFPRVVQK